VALGEGFGLSPELNQRRLHEELGLGVQREPSTGHIISFGHAGSEPGYGANVQYYPCTSTVWALMVNGDGGTLQPMIDVLKELKPFIDPVSMCSG
jgi:D-alanyl-D-alanine carboxypeptidase